MMVLVSKQQYKMQAKQHFTLFCQSEKTLLYKNAGQVGFAVGKVDFQATGFAGQVAVGTILGPGLLRLMYVRSR